MCWPAYLLLEKPHCKHNEMLLSILKGMELWVPSNGIIVIQHFLQADWKVQRLKWVTHVHTQATWHLISQISLIWMEIRLKTQRHQESTCINSCLESEVNFEFDFEEQRSFLFLLWKHRLWNCYMMCCYHNVCVLIFMKQYRLKPAKNFISILYVP
jgi:hypothetical protein